MRTVVVSVAAAALLLTGLYDVFKQKKKTRILDEIVQFVCFIRGELNYRSSDFETLLKLSKTQNYMYIKFDNEKITVDDVCDGVVKSEFYQFVKRIGTTDAEGQLSLCDEYISRFSEKLSERKEKEKNRIQTNTALSVLSALCLLIIFI